MFVVVSLQKSQTDDERGTKGSTSKADDDEVDDAMFDEEEEDDLMRLVRRQREAYSARVAAGRPSIRRGLAANNAVASATTDGSDTLAVITPIATSALTPHERLCRKLIRKGIGRAARLRANIRRDKINMARKAAKECSKAFLRKNTQKNAKGPDCKLSSMFYRAIACGIALTIASYLRPC